MTSPKAPPMSDEPEVNGPFERVWADYTRNPTTVNASVQVCRHFFQAGLAAAPRAGVVETDEPLLAEARQAFDGDDIKWMRRIVSRLCHRLQAQPPAVLDPHAELVAAAYAYRAAIDDTQAAPNAEKIEYVQAICAATDALLRAAKALKGGE